MTAAMATSTRAKIRQRRPIGAAREIELASVLI